MGLFKNEVGRPSNETIKKRNIFKGICALLVIVIIGLMGYILNDKGIINLNNNKNGGNEKVVTTTKKITTTVENKSEGFDKTKITVKNIGDNGIIDNAKEIYIYGNKLDYNYVTDDIINAIPIDDVVLLELDGINGNYLLLVNKSGRVLFDFKQDDMSYKEGNIDYYCSECSGYKIKNNRVIAIITNFGFDGIEYGACKLHNSEEVIKEIEAIYKDGEVTTKVLKSLTGQEYVKKHNIDCSKIN